MPLPQYAMFDDLGPTEVLVDAAKNAPAIVTPEPTAASQEPAPHPEPPRPAELGPARILRAPWWDGRLIWASIDRANGYKGKPGWYILRGATTRIAHDLLYIVLEVEDSAGVRWTSTALANTTIHVAATEAEWETSTGITIRDGNTTYTHRTIHQET